MGETIGVVEWADALARRRFCDRSLVAWVARRLSDAETVGSVWVLVGDEDAERRARSRLPSDVRVFRTPSRHRLGRYLDVGRAAGCEGLVVAELGCPFLDPGLVDNLVRTARAGSFDYATYVRHGGGVPGPCRVGIGAAWYRVAALQRLACQPAVRTDPAQAMADAADVFACRFLVLPSPLEQIPANWTPQTDEDWESAQAIVEAIGCDELAWSSLAHWLQSRGTATATAGAAGERAVRERSTSS